MTAATTTTRSSPGYWRKHGCALLTLGGFGLWLFAPQVPWSPSREVISWSAFGLTIAGLSLMGDALSGWRAWAGLGMAGGLAALAAWSVVETAAFWPVPGVGAGARPLSLSDGGPPRGYRSARGGAGCATASCSGHEAGWRWAEEHYVFDPDDCGGKSLSFEEGCRAWAEDQLGG